MKLRAYCINIIADGFTLLLVLLQRKVRGKEAPPGGGGCGAAPAATRPVRPQHVQPGMQASAPSGSPPLSTGSTNVSVSSSGPSGADGVVKRVSAVKETTSQG